MDRVQRVHLELLVGEHANDYQMISRKESLNTVRCPSVRPCMHKPALGVEPPCASPGRLCAHARARACPHPRLRRASSNLLPKRAKSPTSRPTNVCVFLPSPLLRATGLCSPLSHVAGGGGLFLCISVRPARRLSERLASPPTSVSSGGPLPRCGCRVAVLLG